MIKWLRIHQPAVRLASQTATGIPYNTKHKAWTWTQINTGVASSHWKDRLVEQTKILSCQLRPSLGWPWHLQRSRRWSWVGLAGDVCLALLKRDLLCHLWRLARGHSTWSSEGPLVGEIQWRGRRTPLARAWFGEHRWRSGTGNSKRLVGDRCPWLMWMWNCSDGGVFPSAG